jgi:hypothetical protein
MSNGNDPAYPVEKFMGAQYSTERRYGLTKREVFAMAAMQAYITRINGADLSAVARDSVLAADCLLRELTKEP